ncbi:hypothetical protein Sjap_000231 [Stephania japonica]|uniref:DUF1421 domain-containing protein n=1 Tax=Stephania japonica TaxID=461633 RepID=A0AAP0KHN5_9MAGN
MASGSSSGRPGSGSKGFDFGTDDVLCSYDEFGNQELSNGKISDSAKDFRDNRMGRSALVSLYNQQDDSIYQDLICTVEKTMKKYADNLMRFLEGISARLSQLELYYFNLERSINEMKSDLFRENGEADAKLRSLEKHLQEVHRSVQILRDKQELADHQKELAKLQLIQKDTSANSSEKKEEGALSSGSDPKRHDSPPPLHNHQLALALPHQVSPAVALPTRPVEPQAALPSKSLPQSVHAQTPPHSYYTQQSQFSSSTLQTQPTSQDQYLHADTKYQRPQVQVSQQAPPPPQIQVSLPQQVHQLPQYQQQWTQQLAQQAQLQQQSHQGPVSSQAPPAYPPYLPAQPTNPPPETFQGNMPIQAPNSAPMQVQGSMPMQANYSVVPPQSGGIRPESVGYGYNSPNRPTVQQQPSQHNVPQQPQLQTLHNTYGAPRNENAYPVSGQHSAQAPQQGYMMYDSEGGRVPQQLPSHFQQGLYPPTHIPALPNPPPMRHPSPSPMMRSHQYADLIEKAVSMGYPRDFVASVVHRMEETGQTMDFNSVLDRLNGHSSGGPQRVWSG